MDYNLSIKKIHENKDTNVNYYNFYIQSNHGVFVNFSFKLMLDLLKLDTNNKTITDLVQFSNSLLDNLDCKFIFYDADDFLRYISYSTGSRSFCVGILVNELTFDFNLIISDNTRQQFCGEIKEFINNVNHQNNFE